MDLPLRRPAKVIGLTTIREKIVSQIQQIAEERDKTIAPCLTDDLFLLESGLDSLDFAIVVARLEDNLGIDPFSTADDVDFPITFGDFVRLYEKACHGDDVSKA
jgi:acyl carrier protein